MTANAITYNAITPSRGVAVAVANPSIWYPMHEGTGITLSDALGNGPNMTVAGTSPAASIWANAGGMSPNGTDHVATSAQQAHVDNVCNLASLASGGMILLGIELQFAGANSTTTYQFSHGRDASTAGYGGWCFGVNGSDQPSLLVRGDSAGSNVTGAMGVNIGDTRTAPVQMLLALWIESSVYLRAELYTSVTIGSAGTAQYDLTGLTIPTAALDGLTVGAKRISGASFNSYTVGRMNNLFVQKRGGYSATIAEAAFNDMLAAPREFPRALRG
jgi:hypothetical protein